MKNHQLFIALIIFSLLAACRDETPVPNQEHIIKIEAESDLNALSADGKTIITFKATIPPSAVEEAKNVTFTITPGMGIFQGTVIDAKNTVKADADGIARTSIKLGSSAGTYYISASVSRDGITYRSADLPITLTSTVPFTLEASTDNNQPEANGFTIITLSASTTDPNEKTIDFSTNLGTFTQSTDPVKTQLSFVQGKATTLLRISNQASPHILTFKTGLGKMALLQIQPQLSRPEILLVEPSTMITDSIGGSIQFKCYLRKNSNLQKVSTGYQVFYRAYQLKGSTEVSIGRFNGTVNAITDAEGNVPPVNFFADSGNIDTSKEIIIDCSTYKNASEQLHVFTTVKIKK